MNRYASFFCTLVLLLLASPISAHEPPGTDLPRGLLPFMEPDLEMPALCQGCKASVELSREVPGDSNSPGVFQATRKIGGITVVVTGWMGSGMCLGERPECFVYAPCTIESMLVIQTVGAPPGSAPMPVFWGTTLIGHILPNDPSPQPFDLPVDIPGSGNGTIPDLTRMACGATQTLGILGPGGVGGTLVIFSCSACQ